jgi:hypothetical protein
LNDVRLMIVEDDEEIVVLLFENIDNNRMNV